MTNEEYLSARLGVMENVVCILLGEERSRLRPSSSRYQFLDQLLSKAEEDCNELDTKYYGNTDDISS